MAQFQTQELEYMADFDDNPFEDSQTRSNTTLDASVDSDFEDDLDQSNSKTDTSAAEARNGKDMQGIPWERLSFARDEYRETRLKQYKNFESLSRSREDLGKEYKPVQKGNKMYDFQLNTRLVKPRILHFQNHFCADYTNLPNVARILLSLQGLHFEDATLKMHELVSITKCILCRVMGMEVLWRAIQERWHLSEQQEGIKIHRSYALDLFIHSSDLEEDAALRVSKLRSLIWATSKHDVYLMQNYSLMHWSSLLRRGNEVVNVANPISPTLKYPGSSSQTLSRVQISTMAVKDNLVVVGGFHGELICKYLNQHGVAFCTKVATDENAITNTVDIYHSSSGSTRVVTANNDAQVRVFDGGNFVCLNRFSFPWSVNNTSVSPDGKSLAVLGDSAECLIADAQSGKVQSKLKGHLDYSFASAWHPDGRILATGNQDKTCRLWDVRKLSESLSILEGRMGAIRGIRFTSDGRFMAMAEPADFVHIFDTKSDYGMGQEIDIFGEIAGISFSPDTEALFIGIADRTYGSLLEFNRRHHNPYLDYMF